MRRRGAIEAQFGWIFAVVAGTVILVLFAKMAIQHKMNSESMLASEIGTNLDSLLISVQTSLGISANITLPNYEVSLDCRGYGVEVGGQYWESTFAKRLPIFSPSDVKGKVVAQALGWNVPFRAENFLYLTDLKTAYVFLGPEAGTLYDKIPHVRKYHSVPSGKKKMKLIQWGGTDLPSPLSDVRDINGIIIGGTMESGTVRFYEWDGGAWDETEAYPYLYDASLIAAVFSEDAERYQCGMEKALKRLEYVSWVYHDVLDYYLSDQVTEDYCHQSYTKAQQVLTNIANVDFDNILQIDTYREELEGYNNALKLLGCPLIY